MVYKSSLPIAPLGTTSALSLKVIKDQVQEGHHRRYSGIVPLTTLRTSRMYIHKKLPLVLLSIFRALSNTNALPSPAGGLNVTSSVAPASSSSAALAPYYYSRCDVVYRVDLTIVDDEPWPFADEIAHPSHAGTWVWYYGAT